MQTAEIDGVTYAENPVLFVPVREVALELGLTVIFGNGEVTINSAALADPRRLPDGTMMVPLRDFASLGASIDWNPDTSSARVTLKAHKIDVVAGAKKVIVDKSSQTLEAYQGSRLVMTTHISSGREGHRTPNGFFQAGPVKERMHRSRLYNWAPMPWSVQVDGDIFIHGYAEVPKEPASHGCVRMPMDGFNAAKWLFDWIDVGTPITIQGEWSDEGLNFRTGNPDS